MYLLIFQLTMAYTLRSINCASPLLIFQVLTYSIIGDDVARDVFSINSATGVITGSSAIRTDMGLSYRVGSFHFFVCLFKTAVR